ncbi:MAG: T9SS type A sorting domain-containing protein, partial [Paludibacter sp.]
FTATGGVIIAGTGAVSLNSSEVINAPLTINSGASLNTTSANNYALTFGGNFTNSGTLTANASAITITGTGTQSIAGFTTTGSLTCDKTAGVATLTGNVNAGSLANTGLGGTLNLGSGLTHTISGAWTRTNGTVNGGSSTLNIGGSVTNTAGTFTASTGTVNYSGAAQTIADVNYYNLTFSGSAAKTMGANTTTVGGNLVLSGTASATTAAALAVTGNLTVGSGTTFATGATNSWTLGITGTTSVTGTLTLANTGAKTFTGDVTLNSAAVWNETGVASIGFGGNFTNNATTFTANTGTHTFSGATKTHSGATTTSIPTVTFTGSYTNSGILTSATLLTVTGATVTLTNNGTISASTALSGTGGLVQGTNGILNIGGTSGITTLTATTTGNTVNYNGAAQTVKTGNYYNLTLSGSGTKTLLTGTTLIGGNFTLSGTASTTGVVGLTVNGDLTIGTGTTLNSGAFIHTIDGNWINNGGTFTAGTGTVTLTGSGKTIGGTTSTTFNNLTINSGGTTLNSNETVSNILTLRSGILKTSSSALLSVTATATTSITGASSISFINGPIKWTLPSNLTSGSTYVFPVGKGSTYLPLSLVNPTTGTGTVTALIEAFNTNPSGTHDASLTTISNTEYWSLVTSGNFSNSSLSVNRTNLIAPFDVLAGNATAGNGNYVNLLGTVGTYGITNSNLIGVNKFFCLAQGVSTITLSTSTLSGFSYPLGTGPSTEQSFTVRGNSLIANIALTPATDYEISTGSGASFVSLSQINLTISAGAVPVTTIYVRLKAGLSIGTYSSELITITSGGATSQAVSCSGVVGSAPSVTVNSTSLSGFTYVYTKGPTVQQSFTVSGSNLAGNVLITPPSDYQISTTSGSGYQSTAITLTPTSGTLASRTIYVIMPSGLGVGSHNQNISVTSLGANSQNVSLSGTVTAAPTLTTETSYLGGFVYTLGSGSSGEQNFVLTGTNLSTSLRNDTIIAPTNFEISTTSGSGFTSQIILTRATGVTSQLKTIYVRMLTGLAVGNYGPGNVTLKSSNAIVKTVALAGSVVNSATVLVSSSTLTGFGYMQGAGPSSDQKFTVSGASLTSNITVTPPANYEITTTLGSGYQTTPITLSLTSGRVNPTLIYVRLKTGLTAGNYTGVNITAASSGATTKNVALVGTVFISPLVTAGGGGNYCAGSTINLTSVGADIQNRYWQGPNSFYSIVQNPSISSATTSMSGTYTVTGNVIVGGNLVVNGDFEMGNIGFGSGYGYVDTTNTSALYPESKYTVVKLPVSVHPNFSSWPDHTGRGLQMVVNGAPVAGVVVWSQAVPVIPGATYEFTYWEQTVNVPENPKNASQLQLYVNGVAAGPIYTAPLVNNQWNQFLYNAAAGSNNVLNLELINQNTVASGNDFGLDDIVFRQILPATSTVDVTVSPILPVSVTVTASANPVYKNTPVTFTATPTNGGSTPAYQWQVNGINVGTNSTTYTYTPVDGDVVKCILTSSLTCVSNNPANASVVMIVNTRTNYWYGYIDTDWAKPRNWTGNFVPLPGDDVEYATVANTDSVAINDLWLDKNRTIGSLINATTKALIIPAAKGIEVNNYVITDGNTNRIQIKTSTTLANGSLHFNQPTLNNSVNATVEMYSKATWDLSQPINNKYKWQYFGIPVRTVTANPTFIGSYVRKWVESGNSITNHWIQLANDSVLKPFYGYEICQESPTTIVFTGTLETRDFATGQMPFTTSALYPGQNVYANSYSAGISIKNLDYGNSTEATAYLYNTGTFNEWIPNSQTSGLSAGQYIAVPKNYAGMLGLPAQVASMQSILVKAQSNSSNATFGIRYLNTVVDFDSAIHRIRGTYNNPFENTDKVSTIIDVTGAKTADRLWIVSEQNCSKNFDNGYDGFKFIGSAISPQLYAIEPDGKYQVDAINDINDTELGFMVGEDSEYTLTFTHTNVKTKYAGIYLVDLLENKTMDVTESGSKYEFNTSSSTQTEKRFKVVARHYEENAPDAESQVKIFSSNGNIFIQNLNNSKGDVMIYDIAGHYLEKMALTPSGIITLSGIIPGAYIAKVVTTTEEFSKRLIVR